MKRQCAKEIARLLEINLRLLEICKDIAGDPHCDLVTSERRIRLYMAIAQAGK